MLESVNSSIIGVTYTKTFLLFYELWWSANFSDFAKLVGPALHLLCRDLCVWNFALAVLSRGKCQCPPGVDMEQDCCLHLLGGWQQHTLVVLYFFFSVMFFPSWLTQMFEALAFIFPNPTTCINITSLPWPRNSVHTKAKWLVFLLPGQIPAASPCCQCLYCLRGCILVTYSICTLLWSRIHFLTVITLRLPFKKNSKVSIGSEIFALALC